MANEQADRQARKKLVYLVAGEPSGDALGARLMTALTANPASSDLEFAGIGGAGMIGQGLDSLFPISDLSVMGIAEVLPRLSLLRRRLKETEADIRRRNPAVLVTIDSPGFTLRLAKRLKGSGIPVVHYVAPTVWAWKPGRAAKMAAYVDHVMALFPFEPPFFEAVGLPCTFVGHPIVESGLNAGDGEAFRSRHGIGANQHVICFLPGSRHSEVSRLLPVFRETAARLARRNSDTLAVIPTVETVETAVRADTENWPVRTIVIADAGQKADCFAAANIAVAASGTVALELAMAGIPFVTAYRMSPITAFLARRLVRVRFANLINLLNDEEVIPEFLFEDCTAEALSAAAQELLDDPISRLRQAVGEKSAIDQLVPPGGHPGKAAAKVVLEMMNAGTKKVPAS